jgi:hypothetical protein
VEVRLTTCTSNGLLRILSVLTASQCPVTFQTDVMTVRLLATLTYKQTRGSDVPNAPNNCKYYLPNNIKLVRPWE